MATSTPDPAVEQKAPTDTVLVLACGALARELLAITKLNQLDNVTVDCLPAELHMRPEKIVPAIQERLDLHRHQSNSYDRILIGYGDCGTSGALDELCETHNLERLPGDHCYQFFAGTDDYLAMQDDEPGTFYLTDYLAKHFERFVIAALGIDKHPELADLYFANYRRLIYLSQIPDANVEAKARAAAERLGLSFEIRHTGYGEMEPSVVMAAAGQPVTLSQTKSPDGGQP